MSAAFNAQHIYAALRDLAIASCASGATMIARNISIGEEKHLLIVPSLVFRCVMILCLGFSAGLDCRSSFSGEIENLPSHCH
jgi:hypothetical protein